MGGIVNAALLLCLLSVSTITSAQAVPPTSPSAPELPPPILEPLTFEPTTHAPQPPPPTLEPPTRPQRAALRDNEHSLSSEAATARTHKRWYV